MGMRGSLGCIAVGVGALAAVLTWVGTIVLAKLGVFITGEGGMVAAVVAGAMFAPIAFVLGTALTAFVVWIVRAWQTPTPRGATGAVEYASFWRRLGASCADVVLLLIPIYALLLALAAGHSVLSRSRESYDLAFAVFGCAALAVGPWLYCAGMESRHGATLGKRALGLRVTDLQGNHVSFLRATARFWAKLLSVIPLFAGFIMMAFTARRQALHDRIAGTLVVRESHRDPER